MKISAFAFNGVEWRRAANLFLKTAGKAFQNEILAVGFWVLAAAAMRPGAMVQFVPQYGTYCLDEIRLQILVADIKPKRDLMRVVGCAVDAELRDDDIRQFITTTSISRRSSNAQHRSPVSLSTASKRSPRTPRKTLFAART